MNSHLMSAVALAALSLTIVPAGVAEDGQGADIRTLGPAEQQQVSQAMEAVEEAWTDVETATADRWRSAKETFDQAVIDLQRTWDEVTTDGAPPVFPTSRDGD